MSAGVAGNSAMGNDAAEKSDSDCWFNNGG